MKPITIRTIHPSGYPVTMAIEADDGKLSTLIAQLNKWGFRPDITGDTWLRTPEGNPICQRHQVPMVKREKQGDAWYSHQVTDPDGVIHYCRGYASPNSPGYDLEVKLDDVQTSGTVGGAVVDEPQVPVNGNKPPMDDDELDRLNEELFK